MARKKKIHKGLRAARDKARAGQPPKNLADIKARCKLAPDKLNVRQYQEKQANNRGKPLHKARKQEMERRDRKDQW